MKRFTNIELDTRQEEKGALIFENMVLASISKDHDTSLHTSSVETEVAYIHQYLPKLLVLVYNYSSVRLFEAVA